MRSDNSRPQRIPPTSCDHRNPSQPTEIHDRRSRTAQGHPKTAPDPLSGRQEGSLSSGPGGLRASSELVSDARSGRSGRRGVIKT